MLPFLGSSLGTVNLMVSSTHASKDFIREWAFFGGSCTKHKMGKQESHLKITGSFTSCPQNVKSLMTLMSLVTHFCCLRDFYIATRLTVTFLNHAYVLLISMQEISCDCCSASCLCLCSSTFIAVHFIVFGFSLLYVP